MSAWVYVFWASQMVFDIGVTLAFVCHRHTLSWPEGRGK